MKIIKILTLISILILTTSCTRDDGSNPPTLCLNGSFYALRTHDNSNSTQEVKLIGNSSATTINNASAIEYFNINNSTVFNANRSAYNENTKTFFFLDEWNGGHKMIKANVNSSSYNLSIINLPNTSTYTGLVFESGILYAIEKDSLGDLYLVNINQNSGVSLRVTGTPIPNFNLINDPVGNRSFATSGNLGNLYFLADKLLVIDTFGTIINTYVKPNNYTYLDIVHQYDAVDTSSTDGLFVAMVDMNSLTNYNGIVHWNLSTNTIVERDVITDLNFNPETTALAYNKCGDRIIALSNFVWNGSFNDKTKIWDIAIPNDILATPNSAQFIGSQVYSQFYFGLVHKD